MSSQLRRALLFFACIGSVSLARADEFIVCGADEVFVLKTAADGKPGSEKVWSWRARECPNLPEELKSKFATTDDCKPVDGGKRILITSSGSGVALVERESKRAVFWAAVPNAHSAEMLPGNRLVVAASTHKDGNHLAVFDVGTPEKPIVTTDMISAHGVVWDGDRETLWALGGSELRAYELADWDGRAPKLRRAATHTLPDGGGHDLQAVPKSKHLLLTTTKHVYRFDRDAQRFALDAKLGDSADVKCVSVHPVTGRMLVIQADTSWWTDRVQLLAPDATLRLPGERLYKARWNADKQ